MASSREIGPLASHVRVIAVTDLNGKERKLYIPASLDLDRPKRPRTTFTANQLQILELEFAQNQFITESRRHALALVLSLTETQIKVWFQNRRTKFRRLKQQQPVVVPANCTRVQTESFRSGVRESSSHTSNFGNANIYCSFIQDQRHFQPPLWLNSRIFGNVRTIRTRVSTNPICEPENM